MRDNRIKEYRFAPVLYNADSAGNSAVYTEYPLNGEILEVEHKFNQNGSVFVAVSGTGHEVWRRNASSGANWQMSFPRHFTESTTGSIAGAKHEPFVCNAPLYYNTGSIASGTAATLSIVVKYR